MSRDKKIMIENKRRTLWPKERKKTMITITASNKRHLKRLMAMT
jgi:hypothetical protein